MEGRAVIIAACWIAVAMMSVVYIWVGGISLWTDIAVGMLVLVALIVTFGFGFGELEEILRPRREVAEASGDVTDMRSQIDEIGRKVDEIKRAIEE